MNSPEQPTPQPVSRPIKFVLTAFLFFFLVMGAISLGDLVWAIFRR